MLEKEKVFVMLLEKVFLNKKIKKNYSTLKSNSPYSMLLCDDRYEYYRNNICFGPFIQVLFNMKIAKNRKEKKKRKRFIQSFDW